MPKATSNPVSFDSRAVEAQIAVSMLDLAKIPRRHRRASASLAGPWGQAYQSLGVSLCGEGNMIALVGKRGTGKTALAIRGMQIAAESYAIGRTQSTGHAMLLYTKAMDLFLDLRECYRGEGKSEKRAIERFTEPRLLVIDEIHERGETAWEDRMLVHIIDKRYDALKDTIIVGNMSVEAMGESLGSSIMSRMQECGSIIVCDWPSFRDSPKGPAEAEIAAQ